MFDFLRVVCAVPEVSVGNVAANTDAILRLAEENRGADIIVFPELSLTGYTCADLFLQSTLLEAVKPGLRAVAAKSAELGCVIAVGAPLALDGQLFNCAVIFAAGKAVGAAVKTFIPNYGEYYEKRWFSPARALCRRVIGADELGLDGGYDVPIGSDLVFDLNGEVKFAAEICEDLWTPLPPSTFLALGGAEVILNLSASNETISKRQYRRELVKQQSARCICCYAYASAGKDESTTDLIFSGNSIIAGNGAVLKENSSLIDGGYALAADVDLGRLRADRLKLKSFGDTAADFGGLSPCRTVRIRDVRLALKSDGALAEVGKLPFVPSSRKDRLERCLGIFEMQAAGLAKRLKTVGGKMVVGVSGGLDSTLALLVCARTARDLGRPLTDVVGVTMPCFGTSDRTYKNALELMKTLGVTSHEINIRSAVEGHFADIGHPADSFDLTYENSQARERTQVLMDYAGKVGGFVVGTGDLSELALGWCTYNADHMSMYGVNASIPKTLIRWMIDSIAEYDIFPESTAVLKDITDTPISPELLPPDAEGKISQETEDIIGPYALHDFFLFYVLRYGFDPEKIFFLAKKAFDGDFDGATVLKWLRSFYRRFFTQQFKRSCLPDGVKVGSVCLSPRGDWRMPSDACAAEWLARVDKIGADEAL